MLLKTSRPSGSWLAAMSTRPLRGRRPPSDTGLKTPARSWRREGEAVVRAVEPGAVGDRRHLDRRLGAVGEGVVHFRVEVALGDLFLGPAEEAPDRVRRGVAVARLEVHALAGRGQLEAAGSHPVHQLADDG